jgi:hypothetical protein
MFVEEALTVEAYVSFERCYLHTHPHRITTQNTNIDAPPL